MKPMLVGEVNPYNLDSKWALWPSPVNSSGWRLCKKILEMDKQCYIRSFERANLCIGYWSPKNAEEQARLLQKEYIGPMILLGSRVCEAFGVAYQPFAVQTSLLGPDREILILPHPSGRCFTWNDPDNRVKARTMVREMLEKVSPVVEIEETFESKCICPCHYRSHYRCDCSRMPGCSASRRRE